MRSASGGGNIFKESADFHNDIPVAIDSYILRSCSVDDGLSYPLRRSSRRSREQEETTTLANGQLQHTIGWLTCAKPSGSEQSAGYGKAVGFPKALAESSLVAY